MCLLWGCRLQKSPYYIWKFLKGQNRDFPSSLEGQGRFGPIPAVRKFIPAIQMPRITQIRTIQKNQNLLAIHKSHAVQKNSSIAQIHLHTQVLAHQILVHLLGRSCTLGIAESFTGGLITQYFSQIPGASSALAGGVVSYAEQAKMRILGVRAETLARYGAVSEECIQEMLRGALLCFDSDFALASSGFAGPSGEKVGEIFLGILHRSGAKKILQVRIFGTRVQIQQKGCSMILQEFLSFLQNFTPCP